MRVKVKKTTELFLDAMDKTQTQMKYVNGYWGFYGPSDDDVKRMHLARLMSAVGGYLYKKNLEALENNSLRKYPLAHKYDGKGKSAEANKLTSEMKDKIDKLMEELIEMDKNNVVEEIVDCESVQVVE